MKHRMTIRLLTLLLVVATLACGRVGGGSAPAQEESAAAPAAEGPATAVLGGPRATRSPQVETAAGENPGPATAVLGGPRGTKTPEVAVAAEGETETVSAFDVEIGDCLGDPGDENVSELTVMPCEQPHDNEVFHLVDYEADSDAPFPGTEAMEEFANEVCIEAFEAYVGMAYAESELLITYLQPTEGTWEDGDREVVCTLYSEEGPLEGSMKGSKR